jgi:hypothetical protein
MSAGDANAKGTRTFAGNCDAPREFNQPIVGEKLKLTTGASGTTWTTTLSNTPLNVDPSSSTALYAIRVVAINEQRSGLVITDVEQEDLVIDATMVTTGKAVTVTSSDLSILTWATHVYVNYLYNKTSGVHSAIANVGMYKNVT